MAFEIGWVKRALGIASRGSFWNVGPPSDLVSDHDSLQAVPNQANFRRTLDSLCLRFGKLVQREKEKMNFIEKDGSMA